MPIICELCDWIHSKKFTCKQAREEREADMNDKEVKAIRLHNRRIEKQERKIQDAKKKVW